MATINGGDGSDFLRGTSDGDLILGRRGRDVLLGLGGSDTLIGGGGKDTIDGGNGSDEIDAENGNDLIIGSSGDDFIDGGNKNDTVDYSRLGEAIALQATGLISKGSLGTDQILNVETIIGATGRTNLIDGSTRTSGSTSFDVDFSAESLTVQNVPGLGNINFTVKNFINVIGTAQDDDIVGNSSNNVLQGNAGADFFGGTAGDDTIAGNRLDGVDDGKNDTIDYSNLSKAITLSSAGIVDKGDLGTDELIRVETIVGAVGQRNTIDASDTSGTSGAEINVNLGAESLEVDTNTFPGILNRTIVNFLDVVGTAGDDTIVGSSLNNVLEGGDGADFFGGTAGNDTIAGNDVEGTEDFNIDTVDYTGLGKTIKLQPTGIVNKGSKGTDELVRIETIIGDAGRANLVNGAGASASLNVDLAAETLEVNVGGGTLNRTIVNFTRAFGGNGDDTLAGDEGDNVLRGDFGADTFIATAGNDTLAGNKISLNAADDNSNDTADYSGLNTAITLLPTGTVNKGTFGTDQLIRVDTIKGAFGRDNTIDSSTSSVSLDVDLDAETLEVNIPGVGVSEFSVINFVDVVGSSSADIIVDNNLDNSLEGRDGNDTLESSFGNDTVAGGNGNDTIIADNNKDVLSGGAGFDIFIFGENGNFSFAQAGNNDFASITDFETGTDTIQLAGDASLYSSFSFGSNSRLSIDTNFNGAFDTSDELIATINGSFDFTGDVVFA